ncbi:MAG: hypothetical protein C4524_11635 [Candidatus Zixiibacteriota bacterium]|nr:MAG: hypothetical protein C4524_11635 [candidate division Zixibacteria bacterium]
MFLYDLHTHTQRHSDCSILNPHALVGISRARGLAGIAVTEHHYAWSVREIAELSLAAGEELVLMRGQEVESTAGHVLVYGYPDPLPPGLPPEEIAARAHERGGAIVKAHPFRDGGFRLAGLRDLARAFAPFDAVEFLNGNQTEAENRRALEAWRALGLPGTGGSDAHSEGMVGRFATAFERRIRNEAELAAELRAGRCRPVEVP